LLNTDLHIADISEHMSRQQYVRLTMDTITLNMLKEGSLRHASTPDLAHNDSNSTLRTSTATASTNVMLPTGLALGAPIELDRTASLNRKDSTTSFDRTSERTQRYSSLTPTPTAQGRHPGVQDARLRLPSSASVGAISQQGNKWEAELESALKVSPPLSTSALFRSSSFSQRKYIKLSNRVRSCCQPQKTLCRQLPGIRSLEVCLTIAGPIGRARINVAVSEACRVSPQVRLAPMMVELALLPATSHRSAR